MSTGIQIQPEAAVHFKCPHCAVLLGVSEAQARSGVQGPCPICGGNIPAETSRLVAAELTPQGLESSRVQPVGTTSLPFSPTRR